MIKHINPIPKAYEMTSHTHNFVENYKDLVGFGFNREFNENTVIYYLQKFSDDNLMEIIKTRLSDNELETIFDLLSSLLSRHLSEPEYHAHFLKDDHHE